MCAHRHARRMQSPSCRLSMTGSRAQTFLASAPLSERRHRSNESPTEPLARPWRSRSPRGRATVAVPWRSVKAHRSSEAHTSELQSLMRIWYALFYLNKKRNKRKSDMAIPLNTQEQPNTQSKAHVTKLHTP